MRIEGNFLKLIGSGAAVAIASKELEEYINSDDSIETFMAVMRTERWNKTHLFVDYSNILLSANRGSRQVRHKINVAGLKKRVVSECDVRELFVAGSTATDAQRDSIRAEWVREGFRADFVTRPAGVSESSLNIDDRLLSAATLAIHQEYEGKKKLVLVTGDGNSNRSGCSFSDLVQVALRKSWSVEVWSWSWSLSNIYIRFRDAYPGNFKLYYLDDYFDQVLEEQRAVAPAVTQQEVCRFFKRPGGCRKGARCGFRHI